MDLRRLAGRLFALVCVGTLVAGCGPGRTMEVDGLTVLVGERASNGAGALLSGPVADVGGCAGINGIVVIWPYGTTVRQDGPLTLEVPGQPSAGLGDSVSVGGGMAIEAGQNGGGDYAVAGVAVPASCADMGVWVAYKVS